MSARDWLYARLTGALIDPELVNAKLAEVLREAEPELATEIDRLRAEYVRLGEELHHQRAKAHTTLTTTEATEYAVLLPAGTCHCHTHDHIDDQDFTPDNPTYRRDLYRANGKNPVLVKRTVRRGPWTEAQ
ncbi:hypothetical protein [Streptomyces sp. Ac-502]|uniref:hypothetical protein n=1 Tax=Streptomyces sp. Ac-502 TaxID=3342801 RepID=UPI0038627A10